MRAWGGHTEASHTQAGTHDIQGSTPGLEGPKTRAYRIQGRLQSMAALGNLAVWLHAQILVERAFWTSKLLNDIEDCILEARKKPFDVGFLDEQGERVWRRRG